MVGGSIIAVVVVLASRVGRRLPGGGRGGGVGGQQQSVTHKIIALLNMIARAPFTGAQAASAPPAGSLQYAL